MNIDLQIMLDKLVGENLESKTPINIEPWDFCDLLDCSEDFQLYKIELNKKIIINELVPKCGEIYGYVNMKYPGYNHSLMYQEKKFVCMTSIEIVDM